jgi:hypothetical protein
MIIMPHLYTNPTTLPRPKGPIHRIASHLIMAHIFSVGKKEKTNKQTNMRSQRNARSLHKSLDSPADEFNLVGPSQQTRESTSCCVYPTVVTDGENQLRNPRSDRESSFRGWHSRMEGERGRNPNCERQGILGYVHWYIKINGILIFIENLIAGNYRRCPRDRILRSFATELTSCMFHFQPIS